MSFLHIISCLLLLLLGDSRVLIAYEILKFCGGVIDLQAKNGVHVELCYQNHDLVYDRNSCNLTLTAGNHQIVVEVVTYKNHDQSGNCTRRLELYRAPIKHDLSDRTICFHPTDEQQYTTLDVSFTTKSVLYMEYYFTNYTYARPFIIHVTLQDTGHCTSDEVMCSNGTCIKKSQNCPHGSSCGDNSDQCDEQGTMSSKQYLSPMFVITIAVLVPILLGVILLICCWRSTICRHINDSIAQSPGRFWSNVLSPRRSRCIPSVSGLIEGEELDSPPDVPYPPRYDSIDFSSPDYSDFPPPYNEALHDDIIVYNVGEQSIQFI